MDPAVEGSSPSTHPNFSLPRLPRAGQDAAISRNSQAGSLTTRIGGVCFHWRQYLSMGLLAVSILVARPLTGGSRLDGWMHLLAFLLVLAGGAVRSWAMGYHVWRRVKGPGSERRLITAGPYAFVRNPLYLGTLLISAGIALMSGSAIVISLYVVLFWGGYYAVIRWEEERMGGEFGGGYRRYFDTIPRLLPVARPWGEPEGRFSFETMMRCMEPAKTVAFLVALAVMMWRKGGGGGGL